MVLEAAHREAWVTIRSPETVGWFEQQGSRREAPSTVDELQARLAAMRDRLPDIERITDNGVARAAVSAERQASEHRKDAARLTASAAALQEEKALRSRMGASAPTQHTREMQERAAHIKQARQQAVEQARENTRRAQQEYRYEPPSQGRSGPSRGRQPSERHGPLSRSSAHTMTA